MLRRWWSRHAARGEVLLDRCSPSAGTVGIDYPYPVDEALFATREGMLQLGFDLTRTTGTVAQARVEEGGRRGQLDAHW